MTLFSRVVAINTGLLLAAALTLVLLPATVSATLTLTELAVLAVGIVVVTGVNVLLLRRVFGPLEHLAALMRRIEPPNRVAASASSARWRRWPISRAPSTTCSTGSSANASPAAAARSPPKSANAATLPASSTTSSARSSPASGCNSTAWRAASRLSSTRPSRSCSSPPSSAGELFEAIRTVARGASALPPISPTLLKAAAMSLNPQDLPILGMLMDHTAPADIISTLAIDRNELSRCIQRMLEALKPAPANAQPARGLTA